MAWALMEQASAILEGAESNLWLDLPGIDPGLLLRSAFEPFFPGEEEDIEE